MGTEMVFSGGHRVRVGGTDAATLIKTLGLPAFGPIRQAWSGEDLAEGWVDVQTEHEGVILVNPSQVAYVRDVRDEEPLAAYGN
jgi:hypothetical protein